MKRVFDDIFGAQLTEYKLITASLPLYLQTGRSFYKIAIGDIAFVMVSIDAQERLNISALKKQLQKYYDTFNTNIVYGFSLVTSFQRKSLIENGIPFVSGNGQVYLPFMGAFFTRCQMYDYRKESVKFTPTVQTLLLLLIYIDDEISKSDASKSLGIAPMSVTRASAVLAQLGLINEAQKGTKTLISLNRPKMEIYDKTRAYLINPVFDIVYVDKNEITTGFPAGDYALSQRSDLGYPKYYEYAVSKKDYMEKEHRFYDPYTDTDKDMIKVQRWLYSPNVFAIHGQIDPISLIASYKDDEDERVHKCLIEIEKEIEKWHLTIS